MFGFEKGSKFIEFAIQLTRENCLRYNTCAVGDCAGPTFLTAAVAYFDDPDIVFVHKWHLLRQELIMDELIKEESVTYQTNDATWQRRMMELKNLTNLEMMAHYDRSTFGVVG